MIYSNITKAGQDLYYLQQQDVNLVGLGFLQSASYIKSQPTKTYLLREKVVQAPLFNLIFLGLGWPWAADFVGFMIIFTRFPAQQNLENREDCDVIKAAQDLDHLQYYIRHDPSDVRKTATRQLHTYSSQYSILVRRRIFAFSISTKISTGRPARGTGGQNAYQYIRYNTRCVGTAVVRISIHNTYDLFRLDYH